MLNEVLNVKQIEGEPARRWFNSETMDVFLWCNEADEIIQLQICYDKGPNEQAYLWNSESGISHHSIDDGENRSFRMKSSPIVKDSTPFIAEDIKSRFEVLADNIDHKTVKFILSHIIDA